MGWIALHAELVREFSLMTPTFADTLDILWRYHRAELAEQYRASPDYYRAQRRRAYLKKVGGVIRFPRCKTAEERAARKAAANKKARAKYAMA